MSGFGMHSLKVWNKLTSNLLDETDAGSSNLNRMTNPFYLEFPISGKLTQPIVPGYLLQYKYNIWLNQFVKSPICQG